MVQVQEVSLIYSWVLVEASSKGFVSRPKIADSCIVNFGKELPNNTIDFDLHICYISYNYV